MASGEQAAQIGRGGPLGSGKQYFPWIHLHDEVAAIRWLIDSPNARGAFNLSAPQPLTNKQFTDIIGKGKKPEAFAKYKEVLESNPSHPEALAWVEEYLRGRQIPYVAVDEALAVQEAEREQGLLGSQVYVADAHPAGDNKATFMTSTVDPLICSRLRSTNTSRLSRR